MLAENMSASAPVSAFAIVAFAMPDEPLVDDDAGSDDAGSDTAGSEDAGRDADAGSDAAGSDAGSEDTGGADADTTITSVNKASERGSTLAALLAERPWATPRPVALVAAAVNDSCEGACANRYVRSVLRKLLHTTHPHTRHAPSNRLALLPSVQHSTTTTFPSG